MANLLETQMDLIEQASVAQPSAETTVKQGDESLKGLVARALPLVLPGAGILQLVTGGVMGIAFGAAAPLFAALVIEKLWNTPGSGTVSNEKEVLDAARKVEREQLDRTLSEEDERALESEVRLLVLATSVFGDPTVATVWLGEMNIATGGKPPIALAQTSEGAKHVENLLLRIQYGVLA